MLKLSSILILILVMTISTHTASAELIKNWGKTTTPLNWIFRDWTSRMSWYAFLPDSQASWLESRHGYTGCYVDNYVQDGYRFNCTRLGHDGEYFTTDVASSSRASSPSSVIHCEYSTDDDRVQETNGICNCGDPLKYSFDTEKKQCVIDPDFLDPPANPQQCNTTFEQCSFQCFKEDECVYPEGTTDCSEFKETVVTTTIPPAPYREQICSSLNYDDRFYGYTSDQCFLESEFEIEPQSFIDQCEQYIGQQENCSYQDQDYLDWIYQNAYLNCPSSIEDIVNTYPDYLIEGYTLEDYTMECEFMIMEGLTAEPATTEKIVFLEGHTACMSNRAQICEAQAPEFVENFDCPTCECTGLLVESDWQPVVDAQNNDTNTQTLNYQSFSDLKEIKNDKRLNLILWSSNSQVSTEGIVTAFTNKVLLNGATGLDGKDANTDEFDNQIPLTNSKLDALITNQNKLTEITEKPEITDAEIQHTFMTRLNNVPLVNAFTGFTFQSQCSFDFGSITLLGSDFDLNYSSICNLAPSYKNVLGALSLLAFGLFSVRIVGRT